MPSANHKIYRLPSQPALIDRLAAHDILPKFEPRTSLGDVKRIIFRHDLNCVDFSRHKFIPETGSIQISSLGYMSYSHSFATALQAGNFCSIAPGVQIMGHSHPINRVSTSPISYGPYYRNIIERSGIKNSPLIQPHNSHQPAVRCGHDVWIGANVTMKGGINIGHGAIIAANATVTCDIPPYTIWGGVPARQIRQRFTTELSERLLGSEWWDYPLETLAHYSFSDPASFCDVFEKDKPGLEKRKMRRLRREDILACRKPQN